MKAILNIWWKIFADHTPEGSEILINYERNNLPKSAICEQTHEIYSISTN